MSLQHAAQHLASKGRGKDKMLVHMDKGEVDSLQKIAMANGGSLTINPQTGLPEAGFLSALLPMIAGAGLMMIPGMQAGAAGLIVGGLQTARTGSLSKGIMAGLGAYGGAGLAGSAGAAGAGATNAANASANTIPQYGPSFTDAQSFDPSVLNTPPAPVVSSAAPIPDYGVRGPFTEGSSVLPTSPGGMNVTAPTPPNGGIPQYGPSYTDGQSVGYPAGTQPPTIPKSFEGMNAADRASSIKSGASFSNAGDFIANNKYTAAGAAASIASGMKKDPVVTQPDKDMGQRYSYSADKTNPIPAPDVPSYEDMMTKQGNYGRQQKYFTPSYTPISNTAAKNLYNFADGGMPVEQMSNNAMMGVNTMYPMANITTSSYGTPDQMAEGGLNLAGAYSRNLPNDLDDTYAKAEKVDDKTTMRAVKNEQALRDRLRSPQMATGGISDAGYNLGGYSDGGRLLRGPGDGVSDSIPAVIGKKQPARLADGEFVVPARIVSELGNGSTEAGARKLYAMMDRIQAARKKTVGKDKVAHNSRSSKYLPA